MNNRCQGEKLHETYRVTIVKAKLTILSGKASGYRAINYSTANVPQRSTTRKEHECDVADH